MPQRAKRPCNHPGCPALVESGYCDKHKKNTRQYDQMRGSSSARGYDAKWQAYRLRFLASNPLCVGCMKQGYIESATVVDHIIPHKGDHDLFWDINNHQSLCKQCHDRKTAREDGGFNNPRGV